MSQLRYWVWLSDRSGLRTLSVRRLLEHFGGPMEIYFAPHGAYEALEELTEKERSLLLDKDLARTDRIMDTCRQKGVRILTMQDADYPERLRQISDPPAVLYVRGKLPYLDEMPTIAVVGTRKASAYGVKMATKLGQEITASGGCLVTGMALGIDGASARGALLAGTCVGVLGTAIDVDYPPANASLIADTAAAGAIISEFPPGYPTMPSNFPRRNRIISGLSDGVCVVEAPEHSGALITADLALEQGRDLFAVPGNADSDLSVGTNTLIRECAKAVTSGEDVLSEYEGLYPGKIIYRKAAFLPPVREAEPCSGKKSVIDKPASIPYSDVEQRIAALPEDQQKIVRSLLHGKKHVDEIIAETGLSTARALSALTLLTIRRTVRPLPGKKYVLNMD